MWKNKKYCYLFIRISGTWLKVDFTYKYVYILYRSTSFLAMKNLDVSSNVKYRMWETQQKLT